MYVTRRKSLQICLPVCTLAFTPYINPCMPLMISLAAFPAAAAIVIVVVFVVIVAFMQFHLFSNIDLQLSILCALCTKLNWVSML